MLDIAEAYDRYRRQCKESSLNAEARKHCSYAPSGIDSHDLERLNTIVRNTDLLRDTDTLILHSSADNGYPHTRPKRIICLPAGFVHSTEDDALRETLCHEAIHIHQRANPDVWKRFCMAEGWTPVPDEKIPLRFREKCRLNPDTLSPIRFWAWDTSFVPLPMFSRDIHITLADVKIEWYDLRTQALFHSPPDSFTAIYGVPSQPEHPYEIYAVMLAQEGITTRSGLALRLNNSYTEQA